jgi:hypothetical protein
MRVNKYTATLITFFLSAVVHELGNDTLLFDPAPSKIHLISFVIYGSELTLFSHVDAVQEVAWLPALLANVASSPGSTE